MLRATFAAAIVLVLAGCASLDPTEEEGILNLRNELPFAVSVGYCNSPTCQSVAWTDEIKAGGTSNDSINAAKGTSGWFVIKAGTRVLGCRRLSFPHGPRHHSLLVVSRRSLGACSSG